MKLHFSIAPEKINLFIASSKQESGSAGGGACSWKGFLIKSILYPLTMLRTKLSLVIFCQFWIKYFNLAAVLTELISISGSVGVELADSVFLQGTASVEKSWRCFLLRNVI